MTACRICGNIGGNASFSAREMMFGLRDEFEYIECASCGCLQIAQIPEGMARYYPKEYYSYNEPMAPQQSQLRRFFRRKRLENILGWHNLIGKLYEMKAGRPTYYPWLMSARCKPDSAVADVGCGNGSLLVELRNEGFDHLTGIEPYLAQDLRYGPELTIYRELPAQDAHRPFDLIMLHHSLEHMAEPLSELRLLHGRLRPDRFVLVRIPVKGHAWEHYGTDWVQLDAPRHFYLHTERSLGLLAGAAGFRIERVVYDSSSLQFWGSEQYRKDLPLTDPRSYAKNQAASLFTSDRIRAFERRAAALNRERRGDQACFYLYKPDHAGQG
jgi:SAM-dependent methyltransferase